MVSQGKIIAWFDQVGKGDIPLVGGKGANLGEMSRAGIPVPPGFVVTVEAYHRFLEQANLIPPIKELLESVDATDSDAVQQVSSRIKDMVLAAPMPAEIAQEIAVSYRRLGGLVAVRSSATAEDLPGASFAGQHRTFLNIQGETEVVAAVQQCWASLFEPRAIFYRSQHGFEHLKVGIAVPVQHMVQSEVSGVMFTAEPTSGDRDRLVIEAAYGLGEALVSGEVTPDHYLVDKQRMELLEVKVSPQEWELRRDAQEGEAYTRLPLPSPRRETQKLTPAQISQVAQLGIAIEQLYGTPQDVEWAVEAGNIYIVQTRPITALLPESAPTEKMEGIPILEGMAASRGIAWGPVKVISTTSDIGKVEKGDVLVARMTNPDLAPAMHRAAAIITDEGGMTSHAAIVSREMGIPCVVGTGGATQALQDGVLVTVDGSRGRVYMGKMAIKEAPAQARREKVSTATRLYVNLADPDRAEAIAALDVDGVGLLRAEFIIAHHVREHPRYLLSRGRGARFTERLAQGVEIFAKAFYPRPVVYRTTDFKTNEYRNLRGGRRYEIEESNPMLGYRGCSRYVRDLDAFILEIDAIKKVRECYDNLWVMIPFVRTPRELAAAREIMSQAGLVQSPSFKLWMMVEVPSNIFILEKFLEVGIDGISIGSNDLTQLVLGIDRDSRLLSEDFDERDESVLVAIEYAIKTCQRRGVTSSICGQAPSNYPELTEKLVGWGITSISVTPDVIDTTRHIIAQAESRLGISAAEPAEA